MTPEERQQLDRELTDAAESASRSWRHMDMATPRPGRLTLAEIREASSEELLGFLAAGGNERGTFDHNTAAAINAELTYRATRPHWTVLPSFRMLIVSTLLAAAGLLVALLLPLLQQAREAKPQDPAQAPRPQASSAAHPRQPDAGPATRAQNAPR
jgi:hypothetical protein